MNLFQNPRAPKLFTLKIKASCSFETSEQTHFTKRYQRRGDRLKDTILENPKTCIEMMICLCDLNYDAANVSDRIEWIVGSLVKDELERI